jgi:hypothetical protein
MDSSAPELFDNSGQGCGPSVPQLPLTERYVHVVIGYLQKQKMQVCKGTFDRLLDADACLLLYRKKYLRGRRQSWNQVDQTR